MTRVPAQPIRRVVSLFVVIALVGSLAGCSSVTGRKWGRGGAVGAVGGGLTGLAIPLGVRPYSGSTYTGIVIGSAVAGAVIGGLIGHFLFDKEVEPTSPPTTPPPPK
jgi:hypothetical protein